MADAAIARRCVLEGQALPALGSRARLSVTGPQARYSYRGAADIAGAAFGVALPTRPCTAAVAGARAALWLGPDEWLLLAPEAEGETTERTLRTAIAGGAGSLVEIGHRNVGLTLEGADAARLLNAGCPLDLGASAFPVGMVTRTLLGKVEIVLWRTGPQAFHIETWRSFAPYVVGFLAEAAHDPG